MQPGFHQAPRVETARLLLRAHIASDLDPIAAMRLDPVVLRYIGGTPVTPQQSWARMLGYVGHWHMMGFGYWVVEERATGRVIGEGGLADYMRDLDPRMAGVPELGYMFASDVHGRGYGTEFAVAVVRWADDVLRAPRTVCIVHEENVASRRIVERVGYRMFEQRDINGNPARLYERDAPRTA
jgi:RimJ/RimL family protein N-acetyltransferase